MFSLSISISGQNYSSYYLFLTFIFVLFIGSVFLYFYALNCVDSRFNKDDKFKAYVLSCLVHEVLTNKFINSLESETCNKEIIDIILYMCIGLGSFKLAEKLGEETISICRFFLGFILASDALPSLIPSLENNNVINLIIGLLCSQIASITPWAIIILRYINFSPLFYIMLLLAK
ncbi:hypothetical protein CONCODRAFT_20879 [Conidiobolus coronatus NRRL 28638]|uniref:Uncharacterized protein n=1 Tax=Conidiobolus coronatus (strain ATCC 28846 / CBS 209.66 / NRRL 28638) TaxID=796925 RepID=A0A137NQV1_CONC2|nr:hypothetical protein CONCODRAFT_20879 [Conidiobolus coronatus NRRL 28638]|eukprot:KXN65146.1 hypothetical protein CONCODRAFT_20879 [Conidiobolus coronatus NRRL 28638]